MKWLGAEVIPCRKTEIAQTVEKTMNRLTEEGYHPYYIFGDKFGTGNEAHRYRPTWTATARFLRGRKNRTFLFLISLQHPEPARPSAAGKRKTARAGNGADHRPFDFIPRTTEPSASWRAAFPIILRRIISCCRKDGRVNFIWKWDTARADTASTMSGFTGDPGRVLPERPSAGSDVHRKGILGNEAVHRRTSVTGLRCAFIHTGGTPLFYDCILNDTDGGKK